jgi:small GTP-binding protein
MSVKGKIVLVGDASVGKTSILLSSQNESIRNVVPNVNASTVTLNVKAASGEVKLNVWDTAGQEVYRSFVPMFVRGSEVGIVVFDLSQPESYDHVEEWISLFEDLPPGQCQLVIVGNKSDLKPWKVDHDEVADFCSANEYPFFVTSALTGEGIVDLIDEIAVLVEGKGENVILPTGVIILKGKETGKVDENIEESKCNC